MYCSYILVFILGSIVRMSEKAECLLFSINISSLYDLIRPNCIWFLYNCTILYMYIYIADKSKFLLFNVFKFSNIKIALDSNEVLCKFFIFYIYISRHPSQVQSPNLLVQNNFAITGRRGTCALTVTDSDYRFGDICAGKQSMQLALELTHSYGYRPYADNYSIYSHPHLLCTSRSHHRSLEVWTLALGVLKHTHTHTRFLHLQLWIIEVMYSIYLCF